MKTLVTGAAGFIGSHLVDRLLGLGDTVVGIDNMKIGRRDNLALALKNPRFRLYEMDLNDLDACIKTIGIENSDEPFDLTWHMAANSDIQAGVDNPDIELRDTFLTTFNLLKLLEIHGIPKIAFASSSAVYGIHAAALEEEMGPLLPVSRYGAMKLASEGTISASAESFLEHAWILRLPNVVGGRATHGVIYDFVRRLQKDPSQLVVLGDGSQEKPYFHVSEAIDAILFIVSRATERLNCFNIGTGGSATTVRYVAESVVKRVSPGAKIYYGKSRGGWVGDVPKFNYSGRKLRALGWTARLTSNQAVDQAIDEIMDENFT